MSTIELYAYFLLINSFTYMHYNAIVAKIINLLLLLLYIAAAELYYVYTLSIRR